jgi:hypothetical protein
MMMMMMTATTTTTTMVITVVPSPVSIIRPLLHTHLFIHHRRCIILASDSVVKQGV